MLPAPDGTAADSCSSAESSAYLLRHTACPALEWRLDRSRTAAEEIRQGHPGWQRAEARAILLAICAISGHPAVFEHALSVEKVLQGDGIHEVKVTDFGRIVNVKPR